MTAVSTLDQLDWATCLDQEPGCESQDCPRTAVNRLVLRCGCSAAQCAEHTAKAIRTLQGILVFHQGITCTYCGADIDGRLVSDIATVIPL